MVKAYLRYVRQETFGLVASPGGNVSFFTCPSSVSDSTPASGLSLTDRASAAGDVPTGSQGQQWQYVLTCSGPAVLLWHFSQQTPLLSFTPFAPPAAAASAAAADAAGSCPYHATRLAVSRGNRYLAVGYSDGSVRLWECPTAAALADAASAASALAAACAPDSPAAAAAAAALYPPPLLTLHGHRSAVTSLAWGSESEDAVVGDTHLLSGAGDGDVIVWDRVLGAGVCRIRAHSAPVTALLLLSHVSRASVEARAAAGKAAGTAAGEAPPDVAAEEVTGGAERAAAAAGAAGEKRGSDRRGLLLVSGGKDGMVKIWDADLQLCLQTVVDAAAAAVPAAHGVATAGGRGEVWSLAIDRAQTRLLVGCADHVIRVYKLHHRVVRGSTALAQDAAAGADTTVARAEAAETEETAAAAEVATAAATTAASMGVSVDFVMGLPLFASFFGLLQRQAGGGGSSKRRTTCMQFVDLSVAGAAGADGPGAPKREADSLLVVCSGGSRSVEVYRVCGPRETRRRMRRRRKRQLEKLKKKDALLQEQQLEKAAGKEETACVTDQFVFLYRLHTNSVVKSFDARRRRRRWEGQDAAAATADKAAAFLSTSAVAGGGEGGRGKKKRHKAEQRQQRKSDSAALQSPEHERQSGQHQQQGGDGRLEEVDVVLALADNAVELWRIETDELADAVNRPSSSARSSKKEDAAGAEVHAEKQHQEKQHQENQKEAAAAAAAAAAPAQLVRRLAAAGHRGTVRHLSVSHDSSLLLSLADEGLKIWTVHSRKCVKTLALDFPLCGFFLAGNEHVVVGSRGGELILVDVAACGVQQQQAAHGGPVQALAEHPKHTSFASASSDKTVKFFVLYVEDTAPVTSTASSSLPSASSAIATSTRKQKKRLRHNGPQLGAAAADGSPVAPVPADTTAEPAAVTAATAGGCIRFRQVGSIELPDAGVAVQFTMNGKYVACALQDMTILLFYADSNKLFLSLYGHQLPIYSIAVSSDSTLLASGSGDKTVKIWNVDFGNIQQSLLAHEQAVTQVLFLFQTHYLLSASLDASVKLWDVDKRHCLVSVFSTACNSPITCLAATGDGDMVFAAHASRLLQCWRRSQDQLFVEEEQQRRWEEAADRQALREDVLVGATAASTHVVLERTSKRTIEALRSTERLMEVLDEAREQQELDATYARALAVWEEQQLKNSKTDEVPRPTPPPPKPELMGHTAAEHVLRMLTALRSSDALEVLVALPFDYARRLLAFIVAHLRTYGTLSTAAQQEQQQENRRVLEAAAAADASQRQACNKSRAPASSARVGVNKHDQAADKGEETDPGQSTDNLQVFLCPVETAARVAIIVVQLHFKVFLASPNLRPLLASLRSCLRPLLLQERERLRFNSAACAFFERHLEQERVSFNLAGHTDNAFRGRTRG